MLKVGARRRQVPSTNSFGPVSDPIQTHAEVDKYNPDAHVLIPTVRGYTANYVSGSRHGTTGETANGAVFSETRGYSALPVPNYTDQASVELYYSYYKPQVHATDVVQNNLSANDYNVTRVRNIVPGPQVSAARSTVAHEIITNETEHVSDTAEEILPPISESVATGVETEQEATPPSVEAE